GAVIECFWEAGPFLILYGVSAAAGTLAHHLASPGSMVPLVGASGAIAGVMGAFLVGHPRTRIKLVYAIWVLKPLVGRAGVPAWILLPGWFLLELGFALFNNGDGVAYWAHVGGFLVGIAGAFVMKIGGWVVYDAADVLGEGKDRLAQSGDD